MILWPFSPPRALKLLDKPGRIWVFFRRPAPNGGNSAKKTMQPADFFRKDEGQTTRWSSYFTTKMAWTSPTFYQWDDSFSVFCYPLLLIANIGVESLAAGNTMFFKSETNFRRFCRPALGLDPNKLFCKVSSNAAPKSSKIAKKLGKPMVWGTYLLGR